MLSNKESVCNAGATDLIPGLEDPLKEGMVTYSSIPTPVFLPGESHGHRNLEGYSPQGHKELDTTKATWHTRLWALGATVDLGNK